MQPQQLPPLPAAPLIGFSLPGNSAPITTQEYQLQALHSQVVQLQQHLDAAVRDAQHWAYIAHMAETTNAAETAKATAGTVPSRALGVCRGAHTFTARSNHACHSQPVTRSDSPLSPTVKRPNGTNLNA